MGTRHCTTKTGGQSADYGNPDVGTELVSSLLSEPVPPACARGASVSLKKRLPLLCIVAAVLVVGWSAPGEAQARRGRGPVRVVQPRSVVVVRGGYYFADPFWYGYPWYGYGGWFPYQYPVGGYPYPYGYRFAERDSAVRLEVTPKDAEVFVDGYYAGIVDDFDGVFQRLRVPPEQHEITLYREGYRTVHQTVYLTVDSTFKLRYTMEKLGPGDVAEPRPTPKEPPADAGAPPPPPNPQGPPAGPRRGPVGRRLPPPPPPNAGNPRGGDVSAYGTLAIRIQPGNAAVMIDGERWEGPQGQERLVVELSEGPHRVQIQREGFEAFSTEITIRRGETTPLNVSLRTR
jgi:PEGA domain